MAGASQHANICVPPIDMACFGGAFFLWAESAVVGLNLTEQNAAKPRGGIFRKAHLLRPRQPRTANFYPAPFSSRQRSRAFSASASKALAVAGGSGQLGDCSRTGCARSHTFLRKPNLMQLSWSLMTFS